MREQNLSFYHLGIAPKMLQVLERLKFKAPTPVQHSAIPLAIEGKDVVAVAQTGTGKTLAFGIPMVQRLVNSGGQALVLAPTRDLALQVHEVFKSILNPFKISGMVLIGGMPMGKQIQQLRRKPQVIIATPGRLIDHLEQCFRDALERDSLASSVSPCGASPTPFEKTESAFPSRKGIYISR
jgi:superfamily II DNA/RNA helicase